ncbi:MAG: hypothetical protein II562_06715 [Prevotella sp.]|nr:hypothetical protein [Prevotella sp.]
MWSLTVTCVAAWLLAIGFFAGWTDSNVFLLTVMAFILLGAGGYVWGEKRSSRY